MQLVTIGARYQIVIPKEARRKLKGITPGTKMAVSVSKNKLEVSPQSGNWVERTRGIMTGAWKDIDPSAEIDKMRDEWEEKVKELENELKKI